MKSVGSLAPAVIADLLRGQPLSQHKIDFAWRVAVGSALARATDVVLRDDGTLDVRASSQHWRREVDRSRGLITTRLATLLGNGVVRQIRVDA